MWWKICRKYTFFNSNNNNNNEGWVIVRQQLSALKCNPRIFDHGMDDGLGILKAAYHQFVPQTPKSLLDLETFCKSVRWRRPCWFSHLVRMERGYSKSCVMSCPAPKSHLRGVKNEKQNIQSAAVLRAETPWRRVWTRSGRQELLWRAEQHLRMHTCLTWWQKTTSCFTRSTRDEESEAPKRGQLNLYLSRCLETRHHHEDQWAVKNKSKNEQMRGKNAD